MKILVICLIAVILSLVPATCLFGQQQLPVLAAFYGENHGDCFGTGLAAGDFNNDGFNDVLIGAGGWDDATGRVYLYTGSPFVDSQPELIFQGHKKGDGFDYTLAVMKDFNRDAIEDFAVPSPGYSSNLGKVDIFYGRTGLDSTSDHVLTGYNLNKSFGFPTKNLGDVNGDGLSDLGINARAVTSKYLDETYIFAGNQNSGTILFWALREKAFLSEIFAAGDVNADGYDDILISSEDTPTRLYYGGVAMDTIPDLTFYEGFTMAGIGDINADGFDDIVINYAKGSPEGTFLFFGATQMDTIPELIFHNPQGKLVHAMAIYSGDINGDGCPDVILGQLVSYGTGAVYVYPGGPNMDNLPEVAMYGPNLGNGFGTDVCGAGDVNGDGADDILASRTEYLHDVGMVFLLAGDKNLPITNVSAAPQNDVPVDFLVLANYPNPFNAATRIHYEFSSRQPQWLQLRIYNSMGQEVITLVNKMQAPGQYDITWSGTDSRGQLLPAGVYFCRLMAGNRSTMEKLIVLR